MSAIEISRCVQEATSFLKVVFAVVSGLVLLLPTPQVYTVLDEVGVPLLEVEILGVAKPLHQLHLLFSGR